MLLTISGVNSIAQPNNSNKYNSKGTKVKESFITASNDFNDGIFNDFSQAFLDNYSISLSLDTTVPNGLVSSLYSTMSDQNFDHNTYINNTSLSTNAKEITIEILNSLKNDPRTEFQSNLEEKVTEINSSSLNDNEKEMLLSICATSYQLSTVTVNNFRNGNGPWQEIGTIGGAIIGYVGGFLLCGNICGGVGAIIGGFIGNFLGGLS
jgi:hypothetical protein